MARNRFGRSTLYIPPWIFIVVVTLLVGRLGLRFCEKLSPPPIEGGIAWQAPEAVEKLDPASEKLLLLDFTAAWCGPCKKMEKMTFFDKRVVESLPKNVVPVRVTDRRYEDGDNSKLVADLQDKYYIYSFPEFVIALADGTRVTYRTGFLDSDQFLGFVKKAEHEAWLMRAKRSVYKFDYPKAKEFLTKYAAMPKWGSMYSGTADVAAIYWHVLTCCGETERANEVVNNAQDYILTERKKMVAENPDYKPKNDYPIPLLKFMKGEISEAELLKQSESERNYLADANACIALKALASGDKVKAKEQFMQVITKGSTYYGSYDLAKGCLESLN